FSAKLIERSDAGVEHGRHGCGERTGGRNQTRLGAGHRRHVAGGRGLARVRSSGLNVSWTGRGCSVYEEFTCSLHRRLAHALDDDYAGRTLPDSRATAAKLDQ